MAPPTPSKTTGTDPKRPPLETDVARLGIPTATTVAMNKSASQLSMDDMLYLGWRMLADERLQGPSIEKLWTAVPSEAQPLIQETAVSDPTLIVDHIKTVRAMSLAGSFASQRQIVKLSSHYQLVRRSRQLDIHPQEGNRLDLSNAGDPAQSGTQLLKVCLHYVVLAAKAARIDILEWTRARQPEVLGYPDVDFLFSEAPSEAAEADSKKLKEAALISLLRLSGPALENPKVAQSLSELTVERIIGSALSGVFYSADKVHVISGQKLVAADILRPLQSFPYPDTAAVRTGGKENHVETVVIIGEGKVKQRGISDDDEADPVKVDSILKRPTARAQMAAAVHPTLILLVLAHYRRHNLSLSKLSSDTEFPKFNEKSMVYGIYYDEAEIRVYTHFPQLEEHPEGGFVIRFYQLPVAIFSVLNTNFVERWYLAMALFCVRRHADMISRDLVDVIAKYNLVSPNGSA
ncbi:hypothetical protein DFH07DRAFT_966691 [Mycena maculata]|uniref:Uncharacterized protein n=1 Tax=Mycena maculata TaxID=230809 RepID=A0AAD7I7T3_9AGAR|nr:hypothetical protein DFH07DRAFT_966691 [Mycena maculata]